MTTRPCEFCADWDEEYLEEHLTPDTVCGACNGLGFDEDGEPVYEEEE